MCEIHNWLCLVLYLHFAVNRSKLTWYVNFRQMISFHHCSTFSLWFVPIWSMIEREVFWDLDSNSLFNRRYNWMMKFVNNTLATNTAVCIKYMYILALVHGFHRVTWTIDVAQGSFSGSLHKARWRSTYQLLFLHRADDECSSHFYPYICAHISSHVRSA